MPLSGMLRKVANHKCPICGKEYGNHSKKNFMRCLYTSNYHMNEMLVELDKYKNDVVLND